VSIPEEAFVAAGATGGPVRFTVCLPLPPVAASLPPSPSALVAAASAKILPLPLPSVDVVRKLLMQGYTEEQGKVATREGRDAADVAQTWAEAHAKTPDFAIVSRQGLRLALGRWRTETSQRLACIGEAHLLLAHQQTLLAAGEEPRVVTVQLSLSRCGAGTHTGIYIRALSAAEDDAEADVTGTSPGAVASGTQLILDQDAGPSHSKFTARLPAGTKWHDLATRNPGAFCRKLSTELGLPVYDAAAVSEAFYTIDSNGDGQLSRDELCLHVKQLHLRRQLQRGQPIEEGAAEAHQRGLAAHRAMKGHTAAPDAGGVTLDEFEEWWRDGGVWGLSPDEPALSETEGLVLQLPDAGGLDLITDYGTTVDVPLLLRMRPKRQPPRYLSQPVAKRALTRSHATTRPLSPLTSSAPRRRGVELHEGWASFGIEAERAKLAAQSHVFSPFADGGAWASDHSSTREWRDGLTTRWRRGGEAATGAVAGAVARRAGRSYMLGNAGPPVRRGGICVAKPGRYEFAILSDDGCLLYVGERLVVDGDGRRGVRERRGMVDLAVGPHALALVFPEDGVDGPFQAGELRWSPQPGAAFAPLPLACWEHTDETGQPITAPASAGPAFLQPGARAAAAKLLEAQVARAGPPPGGGGGGGGGAKLVLAQGPPPPPPVCCNGFRR
jgi:hypothetical protein